MSEEVHFPETLTSFVIERALRQSGLAEGGKPGSLVFRLDSVEFADPAGMVSLLELLRFFSSLQVSVDVTPPKEKPFSYMNRMGFWQEARRLPGHSVPKPEARESRSSDVLLEITGIRESGDVHRVLDGVRNRAKSILFNHLNYARTELDRFLTSLSEICQNILEHSGDHGYVAVQKYRYRDTLGKNVVKMIVSDLGKGMKSSLSNRLKDQFGEDWTDRKAIKQALFKSVSRFDDEGRGHGLASVRDSTEHWNGLLTIRSGTARVSMVPDWSNRQELRKNLPHFPGTQVMLMLPEKEKVTPEQKSLFGNE